MIQTARSQFLSDIPELPSLTVSIALGQFFYRLESPSIRGFRNPSKRRIQKARKPADNRFPGNAQVFKTIRRLIRPPRPIE
jgi:hypothetical protein